MGDVRKVPKPDQAAKVEDPDGLEKEPSDSTFQLLLQTAIAEGRIGGKFRCFVCGMRYHSQKEADLCCASIVDSQGRGPSR